MVFTSIRTTFATRKISVMEQTMFDTLLELPLFQGLGRGDLTRILESTRLEFETLPAGTLLLRQDDVCDEIVFVIGGTVHAETLAADRLWSVDEALNVPTVAGLEVLYGSRRTHRHNVYADTPARILKMDKRTVGALTSYFEVFRLNVLNYLTTLIARRFQLDWLPAPESLEGRLIAFFHAHVSHPAGTKKFHIALRTLGHYLGEDHRYVSRALHRLSDKGLLRMERRTIEIPRFELLLQSMK